jgi:hypothetical protein
LVEQLIRNQQVVGSSPTAGSIRSQKHGGSCTLSGVEKVSIWKTIIHDFLGLDIAD